MALNVGLGHPDLLFSLLPPSFFIYRLQHPFCCQQINHNLFNFAIWSSGVRQTTCRYVVYHWSIALSMRSSGTACKNYRSGLHFWSALHSPVGLGWGWSSTSLHRAVQVWVAHRVRHSSGRWVWRTGQGSLSDAGGLAALGTTLRAGTVLRRCSAGYHAEVRPVHHSRPTAV